MLGMSEHSIAVPGESGFATVSNGMFSLGMLWHTMAPLVLAPAVATTATDHISLARAGGRSACTAVGAKDGKGDGTLGMAPLGLALLGLASHGVAPFVTALHGACPLITTSLSAASRSMAMSGVGWSGMASPVTTLRGTGPLITASLGVAPGGAPISEQPKAKAALDGRDATATDTGGDIISHPGTGCGGTLCPMASPVIALRGAGSLVTASLSTVLLSVAVSGRALHCTGLLVMASLSTSLSVAMSGPASHGTASLSMASLNTTLLGNETYLPVNMHTGGDTSGYTYGSLVKETHVLNLNGTLIKEAYTLGSLITEACAPNLNSTLVKGADTHRAGTINGNGHATCCWCGNGSGFATCCWYANMPAHISQGCVIAEGVLRQGDVTVLGTPVKEATWACTFVRELQRSSSSTDMREGTSTIHSVDTEVHRSRGGVGDDSISKNFVKFAMWLRRSSWLPLSSLRWP